MLLGAESWDIYGTADITDYWVSVTPTDSIVAGAGRCGSAAFHFSETVGGESVGPRMGVSATSDGGYAGWGLKPGAGSMFTTLDILGLRGASGDLQTVVQLQPNGALYAYTGPNPGAFDSILLCQTPAGIITEGHYFHIGAEWVCVDAGGLFRLYINGILLASISGVRTRAGVFGHSKPWQMLTWGGRDGCLIDDLYWGDASGGDPDNAFLGDLRVEGQLVLSDADGGGGTHHDFIPSTGTDHGALVDENPPDGDTSYLQSGTPGAIETFKFPNITLASGTVYGIQLMPLIKKTESGTRGIANAVLQGGVLSVGPTQGISQTDYHYQPQMLPQNPTIAAAWTAATANSMEGGIEITV